jgi:hypothetical protein
MDNRRSAKNVDWLTQQDTYGRNNDICEATDERSSAIR